MRRIVEALAGPLVVFLAACGGAAAPVLSPSGSATPSLAAASPSKPASGSLAGPSVSGGQAKPESSALTKVNLAYVVPSTLFLWESIGLKQGLFQKNGLDVPEPVLVSGT